MLTEINLLDWIFAAGQGLFAASFFYFLYLFVRYSRIGAMVLAWLGEVSAAASGGRLPRLNPDRRTERMTLILR